MSQDKTHEQKAALNSFNSEFISNLNELKEKKKKITKKIKKEEIALAEIVEKMNLLQTEKKKLESSLEKKNKTLEKMSKTLESTEQAYEKIIKTSHILLKVLKKDKNKLN